jgi:hypothetical protein
VFDCWTETVFGDVEVDECATHEDAGRVDLLIESVRAIDQEYVRAVLGKQARALESGESGADDGYVEIGPHMIGEVLYLAKSNGKKRGEGGRVGT